MIKISATRESGQKVLILGISEMNVELLKRDRPIEVIGAEVGCDHDIMLFYGKTEDDMIASLTGQGVKMPETVKLHYDDDRQKG